MMDLTGVNNQGECLFICLHVFAGFFYRCLSGFAKRLTSFIDIFVCGALENKVTLLYKENLFWKCVKHLKQVCMRTNTVSVKDNWDIIHAKLDVSMHNVFVVFLEKKKC